jgi:hypothetical protein
VIGIGAGPRRRNREHQLDTRSATVSITLLTRTHRGKPRATDALA